MLSSKLTKIANVGIARQCGAALSTAAKPQPIEKPDIRCTGVSEKFKLFQ